MDQTLSQIKLESARARRVPPAAPGGLRNTLHFPSPHHLLRLVHRGTGLGSRCSGGTRGFGAHNAIFPAPHGTPLSPSEYRAQRLSRRCWSFPCTSACRCPEGRRVHLRIRDVMEQGEMTGLPRRAAARASSPRRPGRRSMAAHSLAGSGRPSGWTRQVRAGAGRDRRAVRRPCVAGLCRTGGTRPPPPATGGRGLCREAGRTPTHPKSGPCNEPGCGRSRPFHCLTRKRVRLPCRAPRAPLAGNQRGRLQGHRPIRWASDRPAISADPLSR